VRVKRVRQLRTAVPTLVTHQRQQHSPPFPDPISIFDLRRVIKAADPEVVITHGWLAASTVVALRGSDVPVIVSAHDYGTFCPTRRLLHNGGTCAGPAPRKCLSCAADYYGRPKGWTSVAGVRLSRWLLARRIVATQSVTPFVDETLNRHFLRDAPTRQRTQRFVIPAFIDMSTEEADSNSDISALVAQLPEEPFILFVGAFRRDKGLDVLFEAYRQLRDPPPLVLLGTRERDTPPFPPGAITLYDVPHAAVVMAWDRALIGVVPSLLPEPLGTVAVEGIAQGVPMIATVPSGMGDVLDDDAGLLIPQGDAHALAEAMRTLLDDPDLRRELSRRGRRRAELFRGGRVLALYEEMLREVIDRRGGEPASSGLGPALERRLENGGRQPSGTPDLADHEG
jgi:glycosyltransferase involved in cell wall biosynthesis